MTGGDFLGLIVLSMAWLFYVLGLVLRLRILPGIVGSLAVFFTVPIVMERGVSVPWPWLWIFLPLVLDPYCIDRVRALFHKR